MARKAPKTYKPGQRKRPRRSNVIEVNSALGFSRGDRVIYKNKLRGTVVNIVVFLPADANRPEEFTVYVRFDDPGLHDSAYPVQGKDRDFLDRLKHLDVVEKIGELGRDEHQQEGLLA